MRGSHDGRGPRARAVYWLYDEHDALLYVGSTFNPKQRCQQHASDKWWWVHVDVIEVQWHDSEAAANAAERAELRRAPGRHNRDDPAAGYYAPRDDPRVCEVVQLRGSIEDLLHELEKLYDEADT